MKKIIRDRSIFVVLASIIMAGVMFFCSVRVMPVRMPAEIRAVMGEEAATSFSLFFHEVREWYDSYEVTPEGVTLTREADYAPAIEVLAHALPFVEAYEAIADLEDLQMVNVYSETYLTFLSEYMTFLMYMDMMGSFPMTVEEWGNLGSAIETLEGIYGSIR